MTVTRKKLMLVPVALLCGAMMFAIGYSFRPSRVSAQQTPAQDVHRQPIAEGFAERHIGRILSKNGALLVLADEDNNAWYQLDDQERASKFLGKKVEVFGRLDASTDVIHVRNIRKIKAQLEQQPDSPSNFASPVEPGS